jgi:hypothetical protein
MRHPVLALIATLAAGCLGSIDRHPTGPGGGGNPSLPGGLTCAGGVQPGPRLLRLLTRREYAATVSAILGVPAPDVSAFPEEPLVDGFDTNAAALVVTSRHVDTYYETADRLVREALKSQRARLVPCAAGSPGCDKQVVAALGKRAFRRPLAVAEVDRYAALFAADLTTGSFDEGVALAATSLFVSPSFLYRSELGEPAGDGTFKLTPYEVAAALAYNFLGGPPDDELYAAADAGQLADAAGVEAQARRLLADPRARVSLGEFFTQWLGVNRYASANKDAAIYPMFNDGLRDALFAESRAFVEHVVFETPASNWQELYAADYVVADRDVLGFYGIPGGGDRPARVTVPAGVERGGILTLGALLGTHAHANESSPIKRGVFVRTRLLCEDLTPPPPDVETVPPGLDPALTTRERFAKHTDSPTCAGCHKRIDPVGFGFERFDGIGAYRTQEGGKTVDDSGEVVGLPNATFRGPKALGQLLAQTAEAEACVAKQYFRYWRGVREAGTDRCAGEELAGHLKEAKGNLKELFARATTSYSFLVRRAE